MQIQIIYKIIYNPTQYLVKILLSLILIVNSNSIFSESIVTQKSDEPDGFYGLKIGGVVSPSFGYKIRDSSSGISDSKSNDQTGFSLPWTLLTINKEWEASGWELELWTEVIRSSVYSNDTSTNSGTKSDPYTLGIRRGNVKKKISSGEFKNSFIFGMQENPHTFTQWNGSWDWRYLDRSPMESLGFFGAPVDLGASWIGEYSILNMQLGVVNGEGYRAVQNSGSTGYDGYARISFLPKIEFWNLGFHFIGRTKNWLGLSGNECLEGKSNCVLDDKNPLTKKEKDLRSRKGETIGLEFTLDQIEFLHFGIGAMGRRDYGGETRDRLRQDQFVIYGRDTFGYAKYTWLGIGWESIWFIIRGEKGTGNGGLMEANFEKRTEPNQRFEKVDSTSSNSDPSEILYSSLAHFQRKSIYLEYRVDSNLRIGLGYSHLINFNYRGERDRTFIDTQGDEKTLKQYEDQFRFNSNAGIVAYSFVDERVFLRASFIF
jgi:hypothetical protein